MSGHPQIEGCAFVVPEAPGLGCDIIEEAAARYPSRGNISPPDPSYDYQYCRAQGGRAKWLSSESTERPDYLTGSVF